MQDEQDEIKDLIADELMRRAKPSNTDSVFPPVDNSGEGKRRRTPSTAKSAAVVKEKTEESAVRSKNESGYLRVEKNLASLGFFTASSKRKKNDQGKTIS